MAVKPTQFRLEEEFLIKLDQIADHFGVNGRTNAVRIAIKSIHAALPERSELGKEADRAKLMDAALAESGLIRRDEAIAQADKDQAELDRAVKKSLETRPRGRPPKPK